MDIEKETWNVIDSYFKNMKDYMVKHHLDSYNDFIRDKLPKLFDKDNDQSFHKRVFVRTDFTNEKLYYETTVYFGGRDGRGFYLSKPTYLDPLTNEVKQLYPNEARLRNLTYASDFFLDIDVEFAMKERREGKEDKVYYEKMAISDNSFLKKIYIGKIPIMLRSCLCVLQHTSQEERHHMGESRYDVGGYFILDGAEKVIVSEERRAENKIFFLPSSDLKLENVAEVKSASLAEFQPARTIKVQMETSGRITVRLGQDKPFLMPTEDGRDVPLFVMFRLLGIESDKEILECICHNLDTDLSQKMINMLRLSMIDPIITERQIYDQQTAIFYLEQKTRKAKMEGDFDKILRNPASRISHLYETVYETFLPHVGRDFHNKACFLGYMVNQFLKFNIGMEKETVRDNFINKRIDLSGFLLYASFRNAIREMVRRVDINIQTKYELAHTEYSNENFANIINEKNFREIFSAEKFEKHFIDTMKRGNIDLSLGSRSGIVQALERRSYFNDIAHLRRIRDPITGKVTDDRRRLHSSQYGCVCPVETPEGQKVGIIKSLSILSEVAFGCDPKPIIKLVKDMDLIELSDIDFKLMFGRTKVFVNGVWIGIHDNPEKLYTTLILYRRNGLFNILTSVAWYREKNEIIISTDQGRFCRPLYIVENNELLIQPKIIQNLKNDKLKWHDLVFGSSKNKIRKMDYFDNNVYEPSYLDINIDKNDVDEDILLQLHSIQSVIEYLDAEELNTRLLSPTLSIPKDKFFTHCELHPSMALGVTPFLIPFLQHNQAARNAFATNHVRQGIGYQGTNLVNRIDTTTNFLHTPERPLCISRLNEYIHNDKMVSGKNITVAICVYNGYNQEDAIIANKSSIDMGIFDTSLYKRYQEYEKVETKTGLEELFYNPNFIMEGMDENIPDNISKTHLNYNKLDKYGFIKEGSILEENDVVIGKYLKLKDEKGIITYRDMSVVAKADHYGSTVDKVFTTVTNINKHRLVKIRVCQYRVPEIGDKFASRNGQKGTIGMMLEKEDMPYTKDGLVPDFLLNAYAYNKRMTIAQFLEILFGRLAVEMCYFGLASPFEPVNVSEIGNVLEQIGINKYSDEYLYNGINGEMMESKIFMGPIYYQRLKHMVHDKINSRTSGERIDGAVVPGGKYDAVTRQPVSGRAFGGGLRIGEMERDAILAHGTFGFLKESLMERSDKYPLYISKKTGDICVANPNDELGKTTFFNPGADGPMVYQLSDNVVNNKLTNKVEILGVNKDNQEDIDFCKVEVPYTLKLLANELSGMCFDMKFRIEDKKIKLKEEYNNDFIQLGGGDDDEEDEDYMIEDEEREDNDVDTEENNTEVTENMVGGEAEMIDNIQNLDDLDEVNLESIVDVNKLETNEDLEIDTQDEEINEDYDYTESDLIQDGGEEKDYKFNLDNLAEENKLLHNTNNYSNNNNPNNNPNLINNQEIMANNQLENNNQNYNDIEFTENNADMILNKVNEINSKNMELSSPSNIPNMTNNEVNNTSTQQGGNDTLAQGFTNIVNDPNIKIVKIDTSHQNGGNQFISSSMPTTFNELTNQLGGIENKNQNDNQTENPVPTHFDDTEQIVDLDEQIDFGDMNIDANKVVF